MFAPRPRKIRNFARAAAPAPTSRTGRSLRSRNTGNVRMATQKPLERDFFYNHENCRVKQKNVVLFFRVAGEFFYRKPTSAKSFHLAKSTAARTQLHLGPERVMRISRLSARQVFERPVRAIGRTVVDLMRSMAMRELTF